MNGTRRKFIQVSLLSGAGIAAGGISQAALADKPNTGRRERSLNILILGGTGFIGPHMVREALRRGHRVSLFNRGRSNSTLFPDLDLYVGDRDRGLDALEGHQWDAVVDNSGYVPRHVADSARLLNNAVSQYLYISSISAYANLTGPTNEDSPLAALADESIEEVTGRTYGPLKALCEKRAAVEIGEDKLTILRPTYICGPGDSTDRFTYWPVRTSRGGEMLWPGSRADNTQIIDVRDLAVFVVDCLEQKITGTYNTVTPAGSYTMGDLHDDCLAVTGSQMSAVWVGNDFTRDEDPDDGGSIPIWASPTGSYGGVALVSGKRAISAGLRNRPVRETARDALTWWNTLPPERTAKPRAGLTAAWEAALLERFRATS